MFVMLMFPQVIGFYSNIIKLKASKAVTADEYLMAKRNPLFYEWVAQSGSISNPDKYLGH